MVGKNKKSWSKKWGIPRTTVFINVIIIIIILVNVVQNKTCPDAHQKHPDANGHRMNDDSSWFVVIIFCIS